MGRDEGTRQNSMQKSQSMEECRDRPECTKDVQQKCLDFSTPTEAGAQVNIVNNATQLQARNEHCQPKSLVDTDGWCHRHVESAYKRGVHPGCVCTLWVYCWTLIVDESVASPRAIERAGVLQKAAKRNIVPKFHPSKENLL